MEVLRRFPTLQSLEVLYFKYVYIFFTITHVLLVWRSLSQLHSPVHYEDILALFRVGGTHLDSENLTLCKFLQVDIPGPLGESAVEILGLLPRLSELNGVDTSRILESEKHVIDSKLQPYLPEWTADEPLADRVLNAMWLYLMNYRLADEEKIDETSIW